MEFTVSKHGQLMVQDGHKQIAVSDTWHLYEVLRARQAKQRAKTAKCDKCKKQKLVSSLEAGPVQVARETRYSPAEYEEQRWCRACRERDEYLSDPFNAEYERARANGWAD